MSSIFFKVKEFAKNKIFSGNNSYDPAYDDDIEYVDSPDDEGVWDDINRDKTAGGYDSGKDTARNREKIRAARQAQNSKILGMYRNDGGPEIKITHPQNVGEAADICDCICDGKACIVDLTGIERNMAQRIADFLGGSVYAVHGTIQRINNHIFIIVPEGVHISGAARNELEKDGYSFPRDSGRR